MGAAAQWQDTFDALFRKSRQLRESALKASFTAERLEEEIAAVMRQRQAMDGVALQVVGWLEVDLLAEAEGEVEVRIHYVVPNALWRPLHSACLLAGKFELSSGPEESIRIQREEKRESQLNPVSKWNEATARLTLYLSNLSGAARTVAVTERLPVSEIEHVKIELDREKTTGAPVLDENGFCTWKVELPANGHGRLHLAYKMSTAPGVQSA